MKGSWADCVWKLMTDGKYYSVNDLASLSGQPRRTVEEVLHFLVKYDFVQRIGAQEPVFRKSECRLSPGEAITMLRHLVRANETPASPQRFASTD
jgi:hypothetical protein